jgi:hypothetical protein
MARRGAGTGGPMRYGVIDQMAFLNLSHSEER